MEIKENWASFFCVIGDNDAIIRLNLALGDIAPIDEYVYRTWFSIKLLNPTENGLSSSEEFPILCDIEDDVLATLENQGAIMAGAIKNNGTVSLYFYSKEIEDYEELINSVMRKYNQYLYAIDFKEDKEWDEYFNYLYPNEYEMQTILNHEVIINLEKSGNKDEIERKVDHWIYFPTENDQQNFIKKVEDLGYNILSATQVKGDFPYQLNIDRMDNTIWENVNNYVWELVSLAKENNGYYDGWGCTVEN